MITKKELLTMDPDTEDLHLVYEITAGPKHGHVENKLQPGRAAVTFTQGGTRGTERWEKLVLTCPASLIFLTTTSSYLPPSHLFANRPFSV